MQPLVSVIVCTYNGINFIEAQLQSLAIQTYSNIEFICSDNNSTDGTIEAVQGWCNAASNRKFIVCNEKGLNKNFFSALKHATGKYVMFSDQDDIWLNTKVERLVNFYEQNNDTTLVYCLSKRFSGKPDSDLNVKHINYIDGSDVKKTLFISHTLGHNICIKKQVLDAIPDAPDETVAWDWWITASAMALGNIKCLPEVLTWWRQHNANTTTQLNTGLFYKSRTAYLQTFLSNPLFDESTKAWIRKAIKKFNSLANHKFSWSLFLFLIPAAPHLFFYKTKKNPLLKWISFIKWSAKYSKQKFTVK